MQWVKPDAALFSPWEYRWAILKYQGLCGEALLIRIFEYEDESSDGDLWSEQRYQIHGGNYIKFEDIKYVSAELVDVPSYRPDLEDYPE